MHSTVEVPTLYASATLQEVLHVKEINRMLTYSPKWTKVTLMRATRHTVSRAQRKDRPLLSVETLHALLYTREKSGAKSLQNVSGS